MPDAAAQSAELVHGLAAAAEVVPATHAPDSPEGKAQAKGKELAEAFKKDSLKDVLTGIVAEKDKPKIDFDPKEEVQRRFGREGQAITSTSPEAKAASKAKLMQELVEGKVDFRTTPLGTDAEKVLNDTMADFATRRPELAKALTPTQLQEFAIKYLESDEFKAGLETSLTRALDPDEEVDNSALEGKEAAYEEAKAKAAKLKTEVDRLGGKTEDDIDLEIERFNTNPGKAKRLEELHGALGPARTAHEQTRQFYARERTLGNGPKVDQFEKDVLAKLAKGEKLTKGEKDMATFLQNEPFFKELDGLVKEQQGLQESKALLKKYKEATVDEAAKGKAYTKEKSVSDKKTRKLEKELDEMPVKVVNGLVNERARALMAKQEERRLEAIGQAKTDDEKNALDVARWQTETVTVKGGKLTRKVSYNLTQMELDVEDVLVRGREGFVKNILLSKIDDRKFPVGSIERSDEIDRIGKLVKEDKEFMDKVSSDAVANLLGRYIHTKGKLNDEALGELQKTEWGVKALDILIQNSANAGEKGWLKKNVSDREGAEAMKSAQEIAAMSEDERRKMIKKLKGGGLFILLMAGVAAMSLVKPAK